MFKPHRHFGFVNNPAFTGCAFVVDDAAGQAMEHSFHAAVDAEGYRVTPLDFTAVERPEVWVFGCSFTFGFSVQDEETYTSILQSRFPEYRFRNFGVSGYSTFQCLLMLRRLLRSKRPAAVIYGRLYEHDRRNIVSPGWLLGLNKSEFTAEHFNADMFWQPRAVASADLELTVLRVPIIDSALAKLDPRILEGEPHHPHMISKLIVRDMAQLAKDMGFPLILADLQPGTHPLERELLRHATDLGVLVVDAELPEETPEWLALPWDNHPNAQGHRFYGDVIEPVLRAALSKGSVEGVTLPSVSDPCGELFEEQFGVSLLTTSASDATIEHHSVATVTLPPHPWRYAASLPIPAQARRGGRGTVRIVAQIRGTEVGFGVLNREGSAFLTRQCLSPAAAWQVLQLRIPDIRQAGEIIVQAWDKSIAGTAQIREISLFLSPSDDGIEMAPCTGTDTA